MKKEGEERRGEGVDEGKGHNVRQSRGQQSTSIFKSNSKLAQAKVVDHSRPKNDIIHDPLIQPDSLDNNANRNQSLYEHHYEELE